MLLHGRHLHGGDRPDGHDHLLRQTVLAIRRERHEAVAGLVVDGDEPVQRAVAELDLDRHLTVAVLLRKALDARLQTVDEVLERRLRRSGNPDLAVGHQKSAPSVGACTPTWARPSFVMTRPRGVRWRKPSWSRYGS